MTMKRFRILKQKKRRGAVCLILALSMLIMGIAGCGMSRENDSAAENQEQGESSDNGKGKGRFMESEIPLPQGGIDEIQDVRMTTDGRIEMIAVDGATAEYGYYRSADKGESWEKETLTTEGYPVAILLLPDGGNVQIIQNIEENGEHYAYSYELFIKKEGQETERKDVSFPALAPEQQKNVILNGGKMTTDGRLLIQDYLEGNIFELDMETGETRLVCEPGSGSVNFSVAGGRIYAVCENEVKIFDLETGEALPEEEVLNNLMKEHTGAENDVNLRAAGLVLGEGMETDAVVYVMSEGIFYYRTGGSVSEQLVNGALNSLGNPLLGYGKIQMLDEEHVLVTAMEGIGKCKLLYYSYDSTVSAVPETELKVYALRDSALLRKSIVACQKKYPDIYINLTIGMTGTDSVTAEDALRTLNTELLAGNGPDVLILDGMPVESYIEKGILADISSVTEKIAEEDGLFSNIYEAYKENGTVYQMPARFYMMIANGDEEARSAAATLAGLVEYAEKKKEEGATQVLPYQKPEHFLEIFYRLEAGKWFDSTDGKISEEELGNWLSLIKRLYDVDQHGQNQDYEEVMGRGEVQIPVSDVSGFTSLLQEALLECGTLLQVEDMTKLCSVNDSLKGDYDLLLGGERNVFVPYGTVGIVSTTKHREAAEQYIRILLGTECEDSDGGFPTNRKLYEKLCSEAQNMFSEVYQEGVAVSTDNGIQASVQYRNLTEEETQKLTGCLESLEKPAPQDAVLQNIVVEQAKAYLCSDQSKEETVANILQKSNLYLAE